MLFLYAMADEAVTPSACLRAPARSLAPARTTGFLRAISRRVSCASARARANERARRPPRGRSTQWLPPAPPAASARPFSAPPCSPSASASRVLPPHPHPCAPTGHFARERPFAGHSGVRFRPGEIGAWLARRRSGFGRFRCGRGQVPRSRMNSRACAASTQGRDEHERKERLCPSIGPHANVHTQVYARTALTHTLPIAHTQKHKCTYPNARIHTRARARARVRAHAHKTHTTRTHAHRSSNQHGRGTRRLPQHGPRGLHRQPHPPRSRWPVSFRSREREPGRIPSTSCRRVSGDSERLGNPSPETQTEGRAGEIFLPSQPRPCLALLTSIRAAGARLWCSATSWSPLRTPSSAPSRWRCALPMRNGRRAALSRFDVGQSTAAGRRAQDPLSRIRGQFQAKAASAGALNNSGPCPRSPPSASLMRDPVRTDHVRREGPRLARRARGWTESRLVALVPPAGGAALPRCVHWHRRERHVGPRLPLVSPAHHRRLWPLLCLRLHLHQHVAGTRGPRPPG